MQSLSSLRSALGSVSASFPLRSHGPLNSISRNAVCPGLESLGVSVWSIDNVVRGESSRPMSQYSGNLGRNFGSLASKEDVTAPYALSFRSFVHSSGRKEFETGRDPNPTDFAAGQEGSEMGRSSRPNSNYEMGRNFRSMNFFAGGRDFGMERNSQPMDSSADARNSRPMDFVRGIIEQDGSRFPRYQYEQNEDFVLIKLTRNNTFVAVTDSKGNKKKNASMTAGWLQKMQGGAKLSQYAAEATAEHVGQAARQLGLKSCVMRVNGFMYFRKKRQAILSFAEGYGKGGPSPIKHIEDNTQRPHNGCRLPKKRRI